MSSEKPRAKITFSKKSSFQEYTLPDQSSVADVEQNFANPYDNGANVDIDFKRPASETKQSNAINAANDHIAHLNANIFDLFKTKNQLINDSDQRELVRVDQSLLQMIRNVDRAKPGKLNNLTNPMMAGFGGPNLGIEGQLQSHLQQKEHEIQMLQAKLELREEQLMQVLKAQNESFERGSQLMYEEQLAKDTKVSNDVKEVRKMKTEIEQLKRLCNKLTMDVQFRDQKIEMLNQLSEDKSRQIDRLFLELDTMKRKNQGEDKTLVYLSEDIERLKKEVKRLVQEREESISEIDTLKRALQAKQAESKNRIESIAKESAAQAQSLKESQDTYNITKEKEVAMLKNQIELLKRENLKITTESASLETMYKKLNSKLEADLVALKQDLTSNKSTESLYAQARMRETELSIELAKVKEQLAVVPKQVMTPEQIQKLQRDLEDSQIAIKELKEAGNKLRQELQIANSNVEVEKTAGQKTVSVLTQNMNGEIQKYKNQITELRTTIEQQRKDLEKLHQAAVLQGQEGMAMVEEKMQAQAEYKKSLEDSKMQLLVELKEAREEIKKQKDKEFELEEKVRKLASGAGPATQRLEEEIRFLKSQGTDAFEKIRQQMADEIKMLRKQIDDEDSKKQAIIQRYNDKLAAKDQELIDAGKQITNLQYGQKLQKGQDAASTSMTDNYEMMKKNIELEQQVLELKTQNEKLSGAMDESNAMNAGTVDAQVARLKQILTNTKDKLAVKQDEVIVLSKRLAEYELGKIVGAFVNEGGASASPGPAMKSQIAKDAKGDSGNPEIEELKSENAILHKRFAQQTELITEIQDRADAYEVLLRKNRIPLPQI
jgi:chromosome segregation ATPase